MAPLENAHDRATPVYRRGVSLPQDLPAPQSPSQFAPDDTGRFPAWRNLPCARTYWYGKEVRAGRKVGHINIVSNNITEIRETLVLLGDVLPEHHYREAIDWSLNGLAAL